jgi:hypothetical protein
VLYKSLLLCLAMTVPALSQNCEPTSITYDSFRTFDLNWGRVGWYKQGE